MENKEIIKKYAITKKTALLIMAQVILIILAFILTVFGIVKSVNLANSWSRIVIYYGQAITCVVIIVFGVAYFSKKDSKYFKTVVISYAILEALRVSLLSVNGIDMLPALLAKFILVALTCDCVLLSERIDKEEGYYVSLAMVGLEIILYAVFVIGFPPVRERLLYLALPFVGILIASAICLFIVGRLEQKQYENKK